MQDEIRTPDRISWKRTYDDARIFGHVDHVIPGFIVAISDHGVRFALRPSDVTKECG
jgi:hypothetical protein